jgi:hypothetical protein
VREGYEVNNTAIAFKRLQARAAASVLDLNGLVFGR